MKKTICAIIAAGVAFFGAGCSTTSTSGDSTLQTVLSTLLPVVVSAGLPMADSYVDSLVADGTLTSDQAAALKEALAAAAAQVTASTATTTTTAAATTAESKAAKKIVSKSVKEKAFAALDKALAKQAKARK